MEYLACSETRFEKVSRKTGRKYKKWAFTGWVLLPKNTGERYEYKGDFLVIGDERYDISGLVSKCNVGTTTQKQVRDILEGLGYDTSGLVGRQED